MNQGTRLKHIKMFDLINFLQNIISTSNIVLYTGWINITHKTNEIFQRHQKAIISLNHSMPLLKFLKLLNLQKYLRQTPVSPEKIKLVRMNNWFFLETLETLRLWRLKWAESTGDGQTFIHQNWLMKNHLFWNTNALGVTSAKDWG